MATITVGLIAHDDRALLEDGLERLKAQVRQPDELLVAITDTMDPPYPGAIILPDYGDKGFNKRHAAGMAASSDYVIFLNHDDWWDPTFISKLMEKAEATNADAVYCWNTSSKYLQRGKLFAGFNSHADNWMCRTSVFKSLGGYAPCISEGYLYQGWLHGATPPDSVLIAKVVDLVNKGAAKVECVPEYLMEIR